MFLFFLMFLLFLMFLFFLISCSLDLSQNLALVFPLPLVVPWWWWWEEERREMEMREVERVVLTRWTCNYYSSNFCSLSQLSPQKGVLFYSKEFCSILRSFFYSISYTIRYPVYYLPSLVWSTWFLSLCSGSSLPTFFFLLFFFPSTHCMSDNESGLPNELICKLFFFPRFFELHTRILIHSHLSLLSLSFLSLFSAKEVLSISFFSSCFCLTPFVNYMIDWTKSLSPLFTSSFSQFFISVLSHPSFLCFTLLPSSVSLFFLPLLHSSSFLFFLFRVLILFSNFFHSDFSWIFGFSLNDRDWLVVNILTLKAKGGKEGRKLGVLSIGNYIQDWS